jgi:hypothetical protein
MRKRIHLAFAVRETDRPFNAPHFPWEPPPEAPPAAAPTTDAGNDKAVGHKRVEPAAAVVTTAASTVAPPAAPARPKVDFAFLGQRVTPAQVPEHLGLLAQLRDRGLQRRGLCPIHSQADDPRRTFSAHLGKNVFQCVHADGGAPGTVLDFWAAAHHLPPSEAALHLAETLQLRRDREEEPVGGTRGVGRAAGARPGAGQGHGSIKKAKQVSIECKSTSLVGPWKPR